MAITNFTYNVKWQDFTKINGRKAGINEDAQIKTLTTKFQPSFTKTDDGWKVKKIDVVMAVSKASSWVVKGKQTTELLQHEQGHYNIMALGVRDMYNKIMALTGKTRQAIMDEAKTIMGEVQPTVDEKDDLYDDQTDHGNITGSQLKWDKNIRGEMENEKGSLSNLV
jgi:predicted secreted Zn-dependent protease